MSARRERLAAFLCDAAGAAAAELSLVVGVIAFILMNVVDLGVYIYSKMQVSSAAQQAAEAIWVNCGGLGNVPVTTNASCSTYADIITAAAQGTALGTNVTASIPTGGEGYYCVDSNGALVAAGGTLGTNPGCKGVWKSDTNLASDYVKITATYSYHSLFGNISVASILPTPITSSVWIRVS